MAKNQKCKLCEYGHKEDNLSGRGNKKAEIMLVLDCATIGCRINDKICGGDIEAKVKYLLKRSGINPKDIYITAAIKCPTKKPSAIKPKCVEACRGHLLEEIKSVKPKVIIAMGKTAHQAVTEETSVYEFRGHFSDFSMSYDSPISGKKLTFECKIMPTYSPFTSLTKWEQDIYLIHDLKKAKKFVDTGKISMKTKPKFKTAITRKALKEMRTDLLKAKKIWMDFETTGLLFHRHKIINAGYCTDKGDVWITYVNPYPLEHTKKFTEKQKARVEKINNFTTKNRKLIKKVLKEVHACKAKKVGHNLKFDAKFAKAAGFPIRYWHFDTVIADALIDENMRHDLNACMEFRNINFGPYDTDLWQYVGKDKKKKKAYTHVPPQVLEPYLAIDVYGDMLLYKKQLRELKREGMYDFMFDRQMVLIKELTTMEFLGHKLDEDKIMAAHEQLNIEFAELHKKICKKVKNEEFNPNSSEQLAAYMEDKGYPFDRFEIRRGVKGFYATGAEVLEKFVKVKKWSKLPEMILRYRKLSKYNSTFVYGPAKKGKPLATGILPLLSDEGRVHTNYNAWTPRTGRLSSNDPNCLSLDTEVLTPEGWVDYNNITSGDSILTFDTNKQTIVTDSVLATYLSPMRKHNMVNFNGTHLRASMTANHRFISRKRSGNIRITDAASFESSRSSDAFIQAGTYNGHSSVSVNLLLFHAAFQADGSLSNKCKNYVVFRFRKARKVDRLKRLLGAMDVSYRITNHADGTYNIYIKSTLLPDWCLSKKFNYGYIDLDINTKQLFLQELRYWDGDLDSDSIVYNTTDKENVDIVQAVAVTSGYRCRVAERRATNSNHKTLYRAFITKRDFTRNEYTNITYKNELCRVWCLESAQGTIITRRGGDVLITGNCQNIPRDVDDLPSVRQFFVPEFDDWCTFEADYKALEIAVAAMLSGDKLLLKLLRNGTDMHTYNMVHVGKKLGMVKDKITYKKFKKFISFEPADPDNLTESDIKKLKRKKKYKHLRFLQKAISFGLNYGKQAVTFAKDLERPREEMEQFIDEYFNLYCGVYAWRGDIKEEALTTGLLTLSTGRKRRFTYAVDWLNSKYAEECGFKTRMLREEIERQALNFPVQGEANEIYTEHKLKLIKAMRKEKLQGTVRLTIHDGFVGNAPKKELAKIKQLCEKIMPTIVKAADGSNLLLDIDFGANEFWYGPELKVA